MMALVLEASARVGSAAVLRDRDVLSVVDVVLRETHREALLPAIEQALIGAGTTLSEIDAIICGEGPGSFTSLRVAAGVAKGIASARGLPLRAVSSLALTAAAAPRPGRYVAVANALRGELFAAPFEVALDDVNDLAPQRLMSADQVRAWAGELQATLVGPDIDGTAPKASALSRAGVSAKIVHPVDLASWEPVYGRLPAAQRSREASGPS